MTLGFTQKINGQPNGFVEKILVGLYLKQLITIEKLVEICREQNSPLPVEYNFIESALYTLEGVTPKLHTIREDAPNRWRAGMDIHFVINNRTANRFQFAPVVKCVSVQEIEIWNMGEWAVECPLSYVDEENEATGYAVFIDDNLVGLSEIERLAINDGFETVADFFAYFNKDFKGKIIHWTNLTY